MGHARRIHAQKAINPVTSRYEAGERARGATLLTIMELPITVDSLMGFVDSQIDKASITTAVDRSKAAYEQARRQLSEARRQLTEHETSGAVSHSNEWLAQYCQLSRLIATYRRLFCQCSLELTQAQRHRWEARCAMLAQFHIPNVADPSLI
jgi:hypothetical protein